MNYDCEILHVLNEAGINGLSVQKITRHVYNNRNTLFDEILFEDVYRYVSAYLKRNSKNTNSIIEKTGTRGVYRINTSAKNTQQPMFDFKDYDFSENETNTEVEDKSLSLF